MRQGYDLDEKEQKMEKELDYEILKEREEMKRGKYNSLEGGYYISGKIVRFARQEILGCFTVPFPDNMGVMPPEYARIKYPSEFRPQAIYTTLDLSVNVGYSIFYRQMEAEEIVPTSERMRAAIKRDHPDYQFKKSAGMDHVEGSRFAFRSHAMDSDLYNIMFIANIDKKTVLGSFCCPYRDCREWERAVRLMWEALEPLKRR